MNDPAPSFAGNSAAEALFEHAEIADRIKAHARARELRTLAQWFKRYEDTMHREAMQELEARGLTRNLSSRVIPASHWPHYSHCNTGEYLGSCKYGEDETCPALLSSSSSKEKKGEDSDSEKTGRSDFSDTPARARARDDLKPPLFPALVSAIQEGIDRGASSDTIAYWVLVVLDRDPGHGATARICPAGADRTHAVDVYRSIIGSIRRGE